MDYSDLWYCTQDRDEYIITIITWLFKVGLFIFIFHPNYSWNTGLVIKWATWFFFITIPLVVISCYLIEADVIGAYATGLYGELGIALEFILIFLGCFSGVAFGGYFLNYYEVINVSYDTLITIAVAFSICMSAIYVFCLILKIAKTTQAAFFPHSKELF